MFQYAEKYVESKLQNYEYYKKLNDIARETIKSLLITINLKDIYTYSHLFRVSDYAWMISKELEFPHDKCEEVRFAGLLHDIGKVGISGNILTKPDKLNNREFDIITNHPVFGADLLECLGFSEIMIQCVKFHHKRFDLNGYPKNVICRKLPIEVAIIQIADAFDAMTTNRTYKKAIDINEALIDIRKNNNTQFHPAVVAAMISLCNKKVDNIYKIINSSIEQIYSIL